MQILGNFGRSDRFTSPALHAASRAILVVGSVAFVVSIITWFTSQFTEASLRLPSQVVFFVSLGLLHIPLASLPSDSGKFYVAYTNFLNVLGVVSVTLSLGTWVFLVTGLVMALLAFFIFRIPEARNTQFLWGNILILLGAALVLQGQLILGSGIQAAGLFIAGITAFTGAEPVAARSMFNDVSFFAMSAWGWILGIGALPWILVFSNYYVGLTWLTEGVIVIFGVSKMFEGFWPVSIPDWWRT
jgi:hypothetical protein